MLPRAHHKTTSQRLKSIRLRLEGQCLCSYGNDVTPLVTRQRRRLVTVTNNSFKSVPWKVLTQVVAAGRRKEAAFLKSICSLWLYTQTHTLLKMSNICPALWKKQAPLIYWHLRGTTRHIRRWISDRLQSGRLASSTSSCLKKAQKKKVQVTYPFKVKACQSNEGGMQQWVGCQLNLP